MKPFVSIPRTALAELLKANGSSLTPEQYLAGLPELSIYQRYPSRASAAAWSKNVLLFVAILGALFLPFGFDLEDLIICGGLAAVTYFEFRVYRYFSDYNPTAPRLGFHNQSAFAAAILLYGIIRGIFPPGLPSDLGSMVDPGMIQTIQGMERILYPLLGMIGGVSQFALAWYYRNAQVKVT